MPERFKRCSYTLLGVRKPICKGESRMSVDDVFKKYKKNLTGAISEMKEKADDVTESPTSKAYDSIEKMIANLTKALRSDWFKDVMKNYPVSEWRKRFKAKIGTAIPAGVDASEEKIKDFLGWLLPKTDKLKKEIDEMDDATFEQRKAKAVAWMDEMHKESWKEKR